ncbi:MAG TPA: histidine kinase [Thermoanaerobaculia bacterium]|nr:histidine kinase [Thermoanaerobaculia bacterium]
MTRWTRSVVVPVAIAVPLLGIAADVLNPLIVRDRPPIAPWENPGTAIWMLWGLLIPLILLIEERWPLAHVPAFLTILSLHLTIAQSMRRLPRYFVLDLLIYALVVAAAHALRSQFELRERERAAAALEADVRRAEVELVRGSIDAELVFRELQALQEDIGSDARRAERRIETLSDHLEQQLATIASLAQETREPLPQRAPERRFLGLGARMWLLLALSPFVFLAFVRTILYPILVLPCVFILVAACTPARRRAGGAHYTAIFVLCIAISFVPDLLLGASLKRAASSPTTVFSRFYFLAVAAAAMSAQAAHRTREREIDESLLRARLADAQLSALRMQLQPHFLFNTLNTIAGLLEDDAPAARLMTERLERFLRMSLHAGEAHEVPLREELRFVTTYLEIQSARFGDRLRVAIDADEDTLDALVPPLILQPLVENAIRHGVGPRKAGGSITVRAMREEQLVLIVEDDGEGARDVRDGIGLANTRARLRQLYGERQRVTIRTAMGRGFAVELRFARG